MIQSSSVLRATLAACVAAAALACVTELPKRAPRPPSLEFVREIVVADSVGAITSSVEEPEAIDRVLASWALSSEDWRAPWSQAAPVYWIEFHGETADVPPRVYGLGRAGSRWWLSSGGETTEWMKSLPAAEQRDLFFDLEIPEFNE